MTLACLPWYDFPETRQWTNELWHGLTAFLAQQGFKDLPKRLARQVNHNRVLKHPNLLLSQTCGYLVAGPARPLLQLVATPCYDAPGCEEHRYSSFIVVHRSLRAEKLADLRKQRCVANEPYSHSGMNCLRALVAPLSQDGQFFASVTLSGSHLRSLEMLARGEADVAAIDCITFELVRRYRPALLEHVRIIKGTPAAPAPPFITSIHTPEAQLKELRQALAEFLNSASHADIRRALLLKEVVHVALDDYQGMLDAEELARGHGYKEMFWPESELG